MKKVQSGSFKVFTYKAGLLARLAHDLQLTLGKFEVVYDDDKVTGTFSPESLSVDGAVKRGKVNADTISASDRTKIHGNITEKILETSKYPEITFEGTGDAGSGKVQGVLTMHGRSNPVDLVVRESAGSYKGAVDLVPSRWGISPFKAMGGAIKLQDKVRVEFEIS
jgi:polyisoprenoid-binding protein YceI